MAAEPLLLWAWDSADWRVASALLDAGDLPNLARLVEQGTMADLRVSLPHAAAVCWTTIGTGVGPDRHRVLADTEVDPCTGARVSHSASCCDAVWSHLARAGRRAHLIGWPASHPAPLLPEGLSVSDRFHLPLEAFEEPWPLWPGSVAPSHEVVEVAEQRLHPDEVGVDALRWLVPDAAGLPPAALHALAGAFAQTITHHSLATDVLARRPWDFLAVHSALPGAAAALGRPQTLRAAYRFLDRMLGTVLELAGPQARVALVSQCGLLLLAGPGFRSDARLYDATLADVAPTLLACFGVQAPGLAGRVLTEAFPEPPRDLTPLASAPVKAVTEASPFTASLLMEQGYADPMRPALDALERALAVERQFHLGLHYSEAAQPEQAIPLFEAVVHERPDLIPAVRYLAYAYLLAGQWENSRAAAERLDGDDPLRSLIKGRLLLAEGHTQEALALLSPLERNQLGTPGLACLLGELYRHADRPVDAERCYRKAIERDPALPEAYTGLAAALLMRQDAAGALDAARQSIRLRYDSADAHRLLDEAQAALRA